MIIPKQVKILYKDYSVVETANLHDSHNDLYGMISYTEQTIHLNQEYSDELKKVTLIHEMVHGLDDMYQIGLSEKKVCKLATALYQFIKDNPNLLS